MMNSTYRYSSTSTSYSPILQVSTSIQVSRVSVLDSRSSSRHSTTPIPSHVSEEPTDNVSPGGELLLQDTQVLPPKGLTSLPGPLQLSVSPRISGARGEDEGDGGRPSGRDEIRDELFAQVPVSRVCTRHLLLFICFYSSVAEWTALLSISTRYAFDRIRSRAIAALSPLTPTSTSSVTQLLDPVDMLVLAVKHDVPQWLEPAYVALCMREHPL
ncbi:hypothetical protein BC629DRAFT_1452231, partial [Irpex lacteus]